MQNNTETLNLTDTHAHLYARQFDADREQMIERAVSKGVQKMFLPNVDSRSIAGMYDLVKKFPDNCFPLMGVHPCSIKGNYKEELEIAQQELDKGDVKFYGIGETGLDFHWDLTYVEQQKEALVTHINWAKKYKLPIILHTRKSFGTTHTIIKNHYDHNLKGIFHCFSGNVEEAYKALELDGFYIGIGGTATYKNDALKEVIREIPLKYMVLETDSPYLLPNGVKVVDGNKRNESAFISLVAKRIAKIKQISIEKVAKVTTKNAAKVYGID